jgi:Predicted transcriptional regulator
METDNPSTGQQSSLHTITTLEALKVFSDPLRQQIIEALLDGAKTVKQVAAQLELAPTKLYYHINLLEEHGLIRVTETRIVSGIIEKHYVAAAQEYAIERSLMTPGQASGTEGLEFAFDAMIEPVRADLHRSMEQGLIDSTADAPEYRKFRMWRGMSQLPSDRAEEFYRRLEALLDEFNDASDAKSEQAYGLLIGIYPATTSKKPGKS